MPIYKPIFVLNGPNLNMLGQREPEIYGHKSLADIENDLIRHAEPFGVTLRFYFSNFEGEIVELIQRARHEAAGIIINPASLSHTSVAIMDALIMADIPIIEVHLSNIFKREAFRHHSYVSPVARGVICGLGPIGYRLAFDALYEHLNT